ncbi:hypothetical protein SLS56_005288 [Neofusicoccum ribis]|uniref:Major facilitator superfamily (MFS) profile domain-containing protein n=1 Tax=Neofusicoccum ribis TaxID=45134 RepID=A0ABR3SU10_9PEZI
MMGNVFAAGISPLFSLLMQDLHCTATEVSRLPGYALLMLGLANLYALPLAEYIGKRYTILLGMLVFLASNIWAAKASSLASLTGSRFIGGFFGGVVEALGPSIIHECFPEHQLASAMVVYVGFLAAGSAIGPIVAGAIATGLNSWRWFFGLSAILIAANLLGCILMLPETTHHPALTGVAQDASTSDADVELRIAGAKTPSPTASVILPLPPSTPPPPPTLLTTWLTRSFHLRLAHPPHHPHTPPLTLLAQLARLLAAPPVLLTTLLFGLTIGWTVLASVVLAAVYAQPPHLFSAWRIGALNFGPLAGLLAGIPAGGAAADMLAARSARRSADGRAAPRARLPAVLPGALVSPAGCLVIGFALRGGWAWGWTAAGWGALAFGLTGSANVLLTHCVDCFGGRAGHVGVLVNVVKNALAFGVSYASLGWYAEAGPAAQFGVMAGLLWAMYAGVVVLYVWSEALVRFSRRFV